MSFVKKNLSFKKKFFNSVFEENSQRNNTVRIFVKKKEEFFFAKMQTPTKDNTEELSQELEEIEAQICKSGFTIETLEEKIEILDKMGENEKALKNCEILLHFDPLNKKCHQRKLKLLKRLRKFKYISDYLNHSINFFPSTGLSNLNFSQKFKIS